MSDNNNIEILLHQHDTAWEALKLWTDELNKLIYWMVLMFASGIALFSQKLHFLLPVVSFSAVIWLYLFKRAVFWYKINIQYLYEIRSNICQICPDLYIYDRLHSLSDKRISVFSDTRLAICSAGAAILYFFYLYVCSSPDPHAIKGITIISKLLWIILLIIYLLIAFMIRTKAE